MLKLPPLCRLPLRALLLVLLLVPASDAPAAPLILNEYNAVGPTKWLAGGNLLMDENGDPNAPVDTFFGRVMGNGGDWFEMVVIADHLDLRFWKLEICDNAVCGDQLFFSGDALWSDLRAGTIITVAEDVPTDVSYDPNSGDWWIQVQATNGGPSTWITPDNFPVSNDNWQLTIRDDSNVLVFGPAGEGLPADPNAGCIPPDDGVSSTEVMRLTQAPDALIDPCHLSHNDYDDGFSSSFGSPNVWSDGFSIQDMSLLRSGAPWPDRDGDGIADDGDQSGVARDAPCTLGNTSGCDDNCGRIQNASQQDTGGVAGPDGMGDLCQCGDPTGSADVAADDLFAMRLFLAESDPNSFVEPERCSVHSPAKCNAVDAVVLSRALGAQGPGVSATCAASVPSNDSTDLMFDPDRLLEIEIKIDLADWNVLRMQGIDIFSLIFDPSCGTGNWPQDTYDFFPSEVTVDGHTMTNVGVRKKGFVGSLSETKPSLKVKFDEFVGGQEMNGMDRLTLNNNVQDPATIRTCLTYFQMAKLGIPAPRCNYAHVVVTTVNGSTEATAVDGIFSHVESIKRPFLRRRFGDPFGRLYEGTLSDFWSGSWRNTIEAKDAAAAANTIEIDALVAVLESGSMSDEDRQANIEALVDLDAFLTFWVGEGLTGHWDGYVDDQNNFWFYVNPVDGLIHFIPWGTDGTFGPGNPLPFRTGNPVHVEAIVPRAALARRLYEMPITKTLYLDRLQLLLDTLYDEAELLAEIDRIEALVTPVEGPIPQIQDVRDWVNIHRTLVQAEINSPPAGFPDQPTHFCFFNP